MSAHCVFEEAIEDYTTPTPCELAMVSRLLRRCNLTRRNLSSQSDQWSEPRAARPIFFEHFSSTSNGPLSPQGCVPQLIATAENEPALPLFPSAHQLRLRAHLQSAAVQCRGKEPPSIHRTYREHKKANQAQRLKSKLRPRKLWASHLAAHATELDELPLPTAGPSFAEQLRAPQDDTRSGNKLGLQMY